MKKLLFASNGFEAKGGKMLRKRRHYRELRSSLQRKGKLAIHRLKLLGEREKTREDIPMLSCIKPAVLL